LSGSVPKDECVAVLVRTLEKIGNTLRIVLTIAVESNHLIDTFVEGQFQPFDEPPALSGIGFVANELDIQSVKLFGGSVG
jgi:hypothetical protein